MLMFVWHNMNPAIVFPKKILSWEIAKILNVIISICYRSPRLR